MRSLRSMVIVNERRYHNIRCGRCPHPDPLPGQGEGSEMESKKSQTRRMTAKTFPWGNTRPAKICAMPHLVQGDITTSRGRQNAANSVECRSLPLYAAIAKTFYEPRGLAYCRAWQL